VALALLVAARFDVEAQQGLGVRRAQVVPPVTVVDGEAVEAIGVRPRTLLVLGDCFDRAGRSATSVLISPESA